ncbi:putative E3 ubiquitin-protein ligase UBR7 [Acipenser ruthenus]|uniref:putative E3 ubiquitin-protein ligase UBR7 n=1 Tax=Acipenser ruthenus TaxID=7906 RepID=UPI0027420468|nr:putative E3 ubiquitin-protein ligase UBR7 [Acipenser ruthenus]
MAVNEGDEVVLSMVDVLEENEELENEASAVLGGSDPEKCSYPKGYVKRQALYACSTCTPKDEDPAGICLACSYKCHEGHDLYELYTKRNFRCDCGNSKFKGFECKLYSGKDTLNTNNKYNQNFVGLYCTCKRPYPDPEDEISDEMIQCIVCEDWFHGRHLGAISTESVELQEMICVSCTNRTPFLWAYAAQLAAPSMTLVGPIEADVDMSMEETEGKKGVKEETENKASEPSAEETPTCKSEGQQPSTSTASDQKPVINGETACKRKLDQAETETCKLEKLKAKSFVQKNTAIYLPYNWRSNLCTCQRCKKTYAESEVPFLFDESDTVLAYEKRGQSSQESDTESRDPLMAALSGMDRVQQLEMIYEYNDLKTELKDYLKRFADEGKVVTSEDIQDFFEQLRSRKRRRVDNNHHYST